MKPVMQTILGSKGNCFSACIASLLEIPIETVPNWCGEVEDGDDWAVPVREWLRPYGLGFLVVGLHGDVDVLQVLGDAMVIVSGKSCRDVYHATIWQNGRLLHDPHPSQCGILEPEFVDLLVPLDPSRFGGHS